MSNSIWETIALTPWWTYVVIWYLLYLSFKAAKPRIVSLNTFIFLHILTTSFILIGLFYLVEMNLPHILICLASALVGVLLGWLHFRAHKIKALKNEAKFYMPGSWVLLILIILLVIAKYYYFGSQLLFNPTVFKQEKFTPYILTITGLVIGLFIGRTLYLLRCIKYGPYLQQESKQRAV